MGRVRRLGVSSLEAPMNSTPARPALGIDIEERRHAFEWFAKGMVIFAAHVLVILGILGLIFLR